MAITLQQAQTHLDAWLAANLAVAKGKSYSMNGRSLTLADVEEIQKQIAYWERRIVALQNNSSSGAVDYAVASFNGN